MEAKVDLVLNDLWIRYIRNKDFGDTARANYWLSRIKEHEQTTIK
jgi:hypothetical protein